MSELIKDIVAFVLWCLAMGMLIVLMALIFPAPPLWQCQCTTSHAIAMSVVRQRLPSTMTAASSFAPVAASRIRSVGQYYSRRFTT